jgi:hypothetical protein
MNKKTQLFLDSIENKIRDYQINTTLKQAVNQMTAQIIVTTYNDGTTEQVDTGVEWFLCKLSPLYFIKRYAWIEFPGMGIIPFKLYYFQEEALKDLQSFQKMVVEKTRQCGMSTVTSLYCFWRANFHDAESIDVVSLKQLKAQAFVSKMNATMKRMPQFLRTPTRRNNTQVIEFENSSTIISESQSKNAGRSDSLSLLVLDEAAHYQSETMVRGIVAAAQPTLGRTGGQFIIISTPNGVAGPGAYYHEQVVSARSELESNTKLVSIDWWEVPDTAYVSGPQKGYNQELLKAINEGYYNNMVIKKKYQDFFIPIAEEEWRDNPWLKKQMDDLQEVLYKQEVLHSFIVGEHQVFNDDVIKRVSAEVIPPIIKNKLGNNNIDNLWIWKNPIPKHRYILGVDVSTGTGKDSSSIQIMDVENYEQVAEYKGFISTKLLGRFIRVIANFYNQGYVVIESNGIGEAVFNEVYYNDNEPYMNVFKQMKKKNNVSRMTGWLTDGKTRKLLTNELIDWFLVDELWKEFKVYSKRLHYEMTTWVWDGTKPDHASGAHDDALIAMALCVYLRGRVEEAGESFLITNEGNIIEYDSKDNIKEGSDDSFDVFFSEEEDTDIFQEKHGMSAEQYNWVISK